MPFTFSHPAIVFPLTFLPQRWFSLTGLVIGSLMPDFEYFLRMRIQSDFSHTISGLFWFNLPLGILVAFIFHNIVRNSLLDNLPVILKSRLIKFNQFSWNNYFKSNWIVVIISVLIGVFLHLFWDSFTHENGYFVQIIPALTNTVNLFGTQIPILKILQHSSTLTGGFIIVVVLFKLTPNKIIFKKVNTKYWLVVTTITLIITFIRLLSGLDFKLYGHVIVTMISALLISLTLTPILIRQK